MKTLQEYILEAMSQDVFLHNVKSMFGIDNDGDYESAYKILQQNFSPKNINEIIDKYNSNSYKDKKPEEEDIINRFLYLFDQNGYQIVNNQKNKRLVKFLIKQFGENLIDEFIKKSKLFNLNNNYFSDLIENATNIFDFIYNKCNNNKILKEEDFKEFLKELFDIENIKRKGSDNANTGKGELLLQLFFGENGKDKLKGDCYINKKQIEIKDISTKAALGSSNINMEDLSMSFLSKILNKNIFDNPKNDGKSIIDIYNENNIAYKKNSPSYKRCLGDESANINICHILNTYNNKKKSITKSICDNIFKIYIETLLSQYLSKTNITAELINDIYVNLENPFSNENNEITCKNLTKISGIIHLIGYKISSEFDLIMFFKNDGNFYIIEGDEIQKIIEAADKLIFVPAEGRANESKDRTAVSKVKGWNLK